MFSVSTKGVSVTGPRAAFGGELRWFGEEARLLLLAHSRFLCCWSRRCGGAELHFHINARGQTRHRMLLTDKVERSLAAYGLWCRHRRFASGRVCIPRWLICGLGDSFRIADRSLDERSCSFLKQSAFNSLQNHKITCFCDSAKYELSRTEPDGWGGAAILPERSRHAASLLRLPGGSAAISRAPMLECGHFRQSVLFMAPAIRNDKRNERDRSNE